jgi:hypothetical protein
LANWLRKLIRRMEELSPEGEESLTAEQDDEFSMLAET